MEEHSEVHVDTEVSSTSSAVPDIRQVTGIHGNVETVIVVEEVKEEDLSYGTPESSPTKSKDEQEAVVTPTLSPEKDQTKKIVISQNKEVKKVYLNKHKKPAMSVEVKCTPPGSELDQRTLTKSGLAQNLTNLEPAQKLPIKLVQMKMTPSKFEHAQNNSLNSEHLQKTLNKLQTEPEKSSLIIEQVPKKLDIVQKMHNNSECTKKLDQMPKTPLKSDQVSKMPLQPDQVPRLLSKPDQVFQTPSKSDQVQKSPLQTDQVPKSPPKSDQVPKSPPKSDQVPKSPAKSDQVPKSPIKSEQVPKSPPKPDQVPKSPPKPDQVPKSPPKPDQVPKSPPKPDQVPKSPPKPDQVPKSPPKPDQVPKSPPKTDQVPKHPSNLDQVPNKPTMSEQMKKITSEQVQKKLEQVLETPTNSDELQNTPTESEQVPKTTSVPAAFKADEPVKIVEQRAQQATIKSLKRQKSDENIIDISDDEVVVNPKRVPESISEKSTKASKQTKELVKEQEQPNKNPGKLDLNKSDSHSNKSEKSSIKNKSPVKDKQNPNIDCFENAEQSKESSDKVKGDKKDGKSEDVVSNTSMDICEKSNDSQLETNSDLSEKDHNRSISRELKSLIKSAKESKIISECTQLTSKTRKSRAAADSNNTSLNTSVEAEKIQSVRRSSINSQKSNCSEKSEKTSLKRSMRSQNPEFVNKVKQFLNSVTGKSQKGEDEDEIDGNKKKDGGSLSPSPKKKKTESQKPEVTEEKSRRLRSDMYCWRCHWAVEQAANEKAHPPFLCTVCPRSFHYKCISGTERNRTMTVKGWICPECMNVLHAESAETQSLAMKKLNHPRLCELLQYAWERMVDLNGVEPFMNPVDRTAFPDYDKYVVHPMDLSLMKMNLTRLKYGSTEAFLADAQWILHNSIIFNTLQSKLTAAARALVRSCRAEMGEIEACPECYAAAHARRLTWFTDVCSTPHILLWAKLKGFPYWPAKGMSVNSQGLVDVRFFGAHDRAWVPARDCFLYCQKDPNNFKAKRLDILESMQEAEDHIRNISRKYGKFVYPAFKTPFDPTKLTEQLKKMIPTFDGEVSALVKEKPVTSSPNAIKDKSRSNSKSSKTSMNEGDASESEEAKTTPPRKMADGAEIAREKDDVSTEKNAPMEIDEQSVQNTDKESSRKRRRSALEEAVITIITTSNNEKRKKLDEQKLNNVKTAESKQESSKAENTQESSKTESTQKGCKMPEETTISETTKPNNNKNEKTDKSNNKGNEKEVPTTPTIVKEVNKEIPTKKVEKIQVVTSTPVKTTPKVKPTKTSTPKEKEDKTTTPKQKTTKPDKSSQIEKDMQNESILRSRKRSKSRNRSLNSSQVEKGEKTVENKSDKDTVSNDSTKEKVKESNISSKDKESEPEKPVEKAIKPSTDGTNSPKPVKDRLQFDDDTSLAVIARETAKKSFTGLPTISSVRSLSTSAQNANTTTKTSTSKTVEVTVSAHCALNVFTPTSTDNVRNMKEAVDKLQKLRNETDKPLVGRVGVRSFARMTSPPAPPEKEKPNDTVEIEVKAEPIDFDDADRQVEKMDLMRSFQLQPVNPVTTASLRDVRINKVIVTPTAKKGVTKTTEVRIRARKTFPTPRKDANDGRSELNGKNTMVYIPIQPPTTQAPIQRATRPITINGSVNTQNVRPQAPASIANSIVNTQTSPLVSVPMATSLAITTPKPTNTIATSSHSNAICVPSVGQMPTMGQICQVPTVGHIPTTVHTVPLITSVNGQWTFSLQPMMSVGSDGTASPPVVNGLSERSPPFIPLTPANPLALLPSTQILPSNNNISNNSNSSNNNGETTPAEMPRLQQRPPLANPFDTSAPAGAVPVPSTAGPLTAKLSQNAVKLADFFRTLLEDSLEKIDDPLSQVTILKSQLEQAKWKHKQEISELKHTHELLTTEMRVAFEKDKTRAISEMRRVAQVELEAAVKAAKTKQWCANCSQEAQFYCCWNTSYCDYSCQRSHWSQHFAVCTQPRNTENNTNENGNSLDKRLQSTSENLPRNAAPPLTAGTKLTPTRVFAQDAHQQKTSIIVSMVEDPSGNQMVKCVGTYKPPGQQQVSPLILNKHLMSNDENAAKKVMTSGGYLIVGAGNNTPLSTNRRTHPVQYTYNT